MSTAMKLAKIIDLQSVDVWTISRKTADDLVQSLCTAPASQFLHYVSATDPIFAKIRASDMFDSTTLKKALSVLLNSMATPKKYGINYRATIFLTVVILSIAAVDEYTWEDFKTLGGVSAILEAAPHFRQIPQMHAVDEVYTMYRILSDSPEHYGRYDWVQWNRAADIISRVWPSIIPSCNPLFKSVAALINHWATYGNYQCDRFPEEACQFKLKHAQLAANLMRINEDPYNFRVMYSVTLARLLVKMAKNNYLFAALFITELLDNDVQIPDNDDLWEAVFLGGTPSIKAELRVREWTLSMKNAYKTLAAMNSKYSLENVYKTAALISAPLPSRKAQIYLMRGHGNEIPFDETLKVPEGRMLVVTTMHGLASYAPTTCRLMELFSRPEVRHILLNMTDARNRTWLSHEMRLQSGHEVHVFPEGTSPPNILLSPHYFGSIAGLQRFPIERLTEDAPYDHDRPCAGFFLRTKSGAEHSVMSPGQKLMQYEHSAYPTLKQVLDLGEGLTSKQIGRAFKKPLVKVMEENGPGIYYYSACRGGGLYKTLKGYGKKRHGGYANLFDLADSASQELTADEETSLLEWQGLVMQEQEDQQKVFDVARASRSRGPAAKLKTTKETMKKPRL